MPCNLNLIGQGEELTILNAQGNINNQKRVITIDNGCDNIISDLTISGGFVIEGGWPLDGGGGIYIHHSDPILDQITISNNIANYGGGLEIFASNPTFNNVTIADNVANENGGGIYLNYFFNIFLNNLTIINNVASGNGGGIYISG